MSEVPLYTKPDTREQGGAVCAAEPGADGPPWRLRLRGHQPILLNRNPVHPNFLNPKFPGLVVSCSPPLRCIVTGRWPIVAAAAAR